MSATTNEGLQCVPQSFEYAPVEGVYSSWIMSVDNEPTYRAYDQLSDVEQEIEACVDEEVEERGAEITRIVGSHGWRTYELTVGCPLEFRWEHVPMDFRCVACGFDTINEYYMVHDHIWSEAGFSAGLACIGCVEERLGRMLNTADFNPALPVNTNSNRPRTARLLHRLGDLVQTPDEN